jgi:hypothetical protein
VGLSVHGDLLVTGPSPPDTQGLEASAIQGLDVFRPVREVIADALHTTVICDDAAAVTVDESAKELLVVSSYQIGLPMGQGDRSFVLSSRPVLRKQAGPVVGAHRHDVATAG